MISVTLVTCGPLSRSSCLLIETAPVGVIITVKKASETLSGNAVHHIVVDEVKL